MAHVKAFSAQHISPSLGAHAFDITLVLRYQDNTLDGMVSELYMAVCVTPMRS